MSYSKIPCNFIILLRYVRADIWEEELPGDKEEVHVFKFYGTQNIYCWEDKIEVLR